MKAIILLLAAALCCGSVRAAVPHQLNYQGFLTNPGGSPVSTTVNMVFSLYDDPALSASPHLLYTETQLNVSVVNGVFNVLIGPLQAAQFSLLAFDVPYWLGVKVGTDLEMTPRQPVAAAAYAIRSATTEALAPTATVPASQISGAIGSATSFTGNLAGDVTGPQATTVVALVGGMTAANVAAGANLANAATSGNTFGALVRRDASGNYSANTISTIGGLNLSTTNGAGTQGVINQAGNRLLHSVGNANFFAGTGAGNFGMTGGNNVGVGNAALAASTSGGQNTAGGSLALSANTSGGQNTASGYAAMQGNLTGGNNAAFGASALQTITGGNFNTAVGGAALASVAGSSSNNIGIGFGAGGNLTSGNFNIDIGNAGVAGESNVIRIGTSQTDTYLTGVVHGNGSGLTLADASITATKLAASGCTAGQILKYSGSAWACAADDTGVPAGGAVGQVLVGTGSAPAWSNSPVISGNVSVGSASAAAARLDVSGSGWFRADANGLSASAAQGVRVFYDTFSGTGSLYAYDYATSTPRNLTLQSPGGNVGIGTAIPGSKLTVAGRIESTTGGVKFPDGTTQTTAASGAGVLAGDVTGPQGATVIAATTVTGKALTGFVSGAGTVSASDTVLTAINKLDGNVVLATPLSSRNPMQIALRRWYDANQSGNTNFAVGTYPAAVAFDGANIWVTNASSSSVTKLRASDGACVGTCTFAVGVSPVAVTFDGANIWAANASSNSLTRLRASDGACVGTCTFAVGFSPVAVDFDGANLWVVNGSSNSVTKLRASDGVCVGTCTFAVGAQPGAIAFDGTNIWVANQNGGNVTKLRASDGACVGTCTFAVGGTPFALAFDGTNMWVVSEFSGTVTKLRASDGACVGTCTFTVGSYPVAVAFDGTNIWVANFLSNDVTKLRASDGACVGTCTFVVGTGPRGVAFDGANIWVTNSNSNTVTKL